MKLISMTEFVLERCLKDISEYTVVDAFKDGAKVMNEIFSYAKFLNQPLTLVMFVPCDEDGNVLEEPNGFDLWISGIVSDSNEFDKYQQAKNKVLFENYTARKIEDYYLVLCPDGSNVWVSWNKSKKIESLINEKTNVTLTPNAIKQLKL